MPPTPPNFQQENESLERQSLGEFVRQLVREGKTYREVMEITGLKSTSAVAHHAQGVHAHKLFQYKELQSDDSPYWYCRTCGWEFVENRVEGAPGFPRLQNIGRAAEALYDNRLGWSDGRNPYAPPEYWDKLGEALGRPSSGFCNSPEAA